MALTCLRSNRKFRQRRPQEAPLWTKVESFHRDLRRFEQRIFTPLPTLILIALDLYFYAVEHEKIHAKKSRSRFRCKTEDSWSKLCLKLED